jgi:NhaA family Na+:H+ antiporter
MDQPRARPPEYLALKLFKPLERFLRVQAASGIVLLAATAVALVWANSPWASSYSSLWEAPFTIGYGVLIAEQPLRFWVNEGLMTVFFLLVGLEIRRELHDGALASARAAALPVAAAAGGIIVPALIYVALNSDPLLLRGWAVPTATDIAFAIGALTVLGARVPRSLRVLLLALAIIDDIAAILVIAFFYSEGIAPAGLLIALGGVMGVLLFRRLGIRNALAYVIPGALLWIGLLRAGVHPTLAGVVLGLLTPVTSAGPRDNLLASASAALNDFRDRLRRPQRASDELLEPVRQLKLAQRELLAPVVRVETAIHPWVAYGIMPLFALANAGISLGGLDFASPAAMTLTAGVALGLVIGKPLGIVLASALAVRTRLSALPDDVSWSGVLVVGCLGGIGFTMSIFIANLAFQDEALLSLAKFAVLAASAAAAAIALLIGRFATLTARAGGEPAGELTGSPRLEEVARDER